MNGRMELVEILGMVGTCAALLFAGFAVETLKVGVHGGWTVSDVEIEEPAVPDPMVLPEEARIAAPIIERPTELSPPPVSEVMPPAVSDIRPPGDCQGEPVSTES